jgi:hypothetical protein
VPVIGGVIADQHGLAAVFYLLGGTMLIANLLVYLLPNERGAEQGGRERRGT